MTRARLDRGLGVLTTRIGRRLVLAFLGCAFLPLLAFALLTFRHVSGELWRQNEIALHDAAKTAGMGIAARLQQLAGDVDALREIANRRRAGDAVDVLQVRAAALVRNCDAAWSDDGREPLLLWGAAGAVPPRLPAWTPEQSAHLAAGRSLLVPVGTPTRLVLVAAAAPGDPARGRLLALPRSEWLWDLDELRGRGADVVVFDGASHLLCRSSAALPDPAPLFAAIGGSPASGTVEWDVAGEPHLARYWRVFLRPQYGLDLLLVQSRPRAVALAPVHGFESWFVGTAFGALLCVAVASLVQLRRMLGPIVTLGEATRRVAGGDFSARSAIAGGDEFGDLGRAFDHMTAQLAELVARREQGERELRESRDAALAAARAKSEFVTNVSHEFRTPMAEILGATEILLSLGDADPGARVEFAAIAHRGAQRLSSLVDDVLELGAPAAWELAPIDVVGTLSSAVADLPAPLAARTELTVHGPLPPVAGVAHRLADCWRRLIDNAFKFSPADRPVQIVARAVAGEVVVEVTDQGVGISRLDLESIFEPFRQFGRDQLTEKAPGTGLGLSIVRNTVVRLGGRVEVDSELGNGATFRVHLPAAREGADRNEAAPAAIAPAAAAD